MEGSRPMSRQSSLSRDSRQLRLIEAKQQRKQSESEVTLLANRVALLKVEESKAWKKIEDTRKRAKEIMELRARNLEQQRVREENRKEKEDEKLMRLMQNRLQKEQDTQYREMTREQMKSKLKAEVEEIKRKKLENIELISQQKTATLNYNTEVYMHIRNSQKEFADRRRQDEEERRARARAEYEAKLESELKIKASKDEEIERLEKEEIELIAKLQNTQILQRSAFEDLEAVIGGRLDSCSFSHSNSP
jgi:hypothetical protein